MHDLRLKIDKYTFQVWTLQILDLYFKLSPFQTKFYGFNTKFNLAIDPQSLKLSHL
jgi:hypothetical protein